MKISTLITAAAGLSIAATAAQASLIVYEPFNYSDSTSNPVPPPGGDGSAYSSTTGSVGLRNAWNGTVASGSLSFTGALASGGNSLSIGAGVNQNNAGPWMYRNMTSDPFDAYRDGGNALGAVGTTLFGSLLVDMSGVASGDRFWLRLTGNDNTHNHLTIYTADGGNWTMFQINDSAAQPSGTSLTTNTGVAATTDTTLLIWQQDFTATNTITSVWINDPTASGAADLVFTSSGAVNFAGIGYRTGNNTALIDELRIGTTLSAVAVPEPSTYAALFGALALAGVMLRRRRKA